MAHALGLEDQIKKAATAGRVRIFSRRDGNPGRFEYGAAVSSTVLMNDETFAMQQQLGAGFDAASLELQAIWTVTLTDEDIWAALIGAVTLAGKTRVQLRFQDRTRLYASDDGTYQFVRQPGHTVQKLRGGGLHHIASAGAVARDALQTIDRQPQSILPDLFSGDVVATDAGTELVTVKMVGYGPTVSQDIDLGENPASMPRSGKLPRLTLTLDTTPALSLSLPLSLPLPLPLIRIFGQMIRPFGNGQRISSGAVAPSRSGSPGFADAPAYHPVIFAHDPRAVDGGAEQSDVSIVIHNDPGVTDNTTRIDTRLTRPG